MPKRHGIPKCIGRIRCDQLAVDLKRLMTLFLKSLMGGSLGVWGGWLLVTGSPVPVHSD